jgi:dienelactone hydrolase
MTQTLVRAIFRSVRIPGLIAPNDTAHLKIHYQAVYTGSDMENNTGLLPAVTDAPLSPVVVLLPGINVGPEGLGWLASALCKRGLVVVTYSLIGEELPGQISLTPGIDIMSLAPDAYGTRPSALALGPILADLAACNEAGVLGGRLDLSKIAFGGHSAGGTVALLNANPDWFEGACAAFAYGAHTAAATMLGHPPGSMNAISDKSPVLIMGGAEDGVIAGSASRYGDPDGDATGRVIATYEQAVTREKGDCVLAILKGANHFSIIDPQDASTGRAFLDRPDTSRDARGLMESLIWAFLAKAMGLSGAQEAWAQVEARIDAFALFKQK